MAQPNGTVDNNTIMKRIQLNGFIIIAAVLLNISCTHLSGDGDIKIYPVEVENTQEITKMIEDAAPSYFNIIDIYRLKVYSLGEYYITQSILCGPSGRASNYYHYLLMDKDYSKKAYFMSLSSEINNVWIERDTLFANLLDFIDEAYDNGEYSNCKKCKYAVCHMKLISSSFVLDVVSEEEVCLWQKDLDKYLSLYRGCQP